MKLFEEIMEKMNNSSLNNIESSMADIINYVNGKYDVDIADQIMKEWTENGNGTYFHQNHSLIFEILYENTNRVR